MEALLQRLRELPPLVLDIHQTLAAEKRRKRQEANTASGAAAVGSDTEDLGVDEAPLENTLALTVARTEAIRIAQQVNLDRAASNGIGLRQLAIAQQRVQGL
ncbi:hypothetical protein EG327_011729 [Venturia inaequalis]|uniref:Uncharacterized protein n=1 Tax=Venturia inaequalis TaxID=5025 RepID=A0A8H3UAZ8_VENIN|nr:hypothetical protein EG327_011729 [Venturia inaequalis]